MHRFCFIVFVLLFVQAAAAQSNAVPKVAEPTMQQLKVELAEDKVQLAQLRAQVHQLQAQVQLYAKFVGVTDADQADQKAIQAAIEELQKIRRTAGAAVPAIK